MRYGNTRLTMPIFRRTFIGARLAAWWMRMPVHSVGRNGGLPGAHDLHRAPIGVAGSMSVEFFGRLRGLQHSVEGIVPQHGGILRCETCGSTQEPRGEYMSTGWPQCHGFTMRWWTRRQIDAGEMVALTESEPGDQS